MSKGIFVPAVIRGRTAPRNTLSMFGCRTFGFIEAKGFGGVSEADPGVPASFKGMAEEIIEF